MNSLQDGKKESFLANQAELMVLAICLALGLVLLTEPLHKYPWLRSDALQVPVSIIESAMFLISLMMKCGSTITCIIPRLAL